MARKVYVSSDMAHDERLIEVAAESPEAALLWPWILTHFDDWGRAEANTLRMKAKLFPMNALVTVDLLERTLALFAKVGLIVLYEHHGKRYMAIPSEKWYKYQTHIRRERRPGKDKLASDCPPPPDKAQEEDGATADPQEPPQTPAGNRGTLRFPVLTPSTLPPYYPTQTDRLTVDASVNESASADESVSQSVSPSPVTNDLPEPSDDMDWPDVTARYHRRLGVLGPLILARLEHWREQGLSSGAIVTAIDRTAAARDEKRIRGHPDHYLDGVLRGMYNDGIRTVEDIRKRDGPQTEEDAVAAILERASQAGSSAADIQAILRRAGEVN